MAVTSVLVPKGNNASNSVRVEMMDYWDRGYGKAEMAYSKGIQIPPVGSYRFFYWMGRYEACYRTCCQILKMYHFREGLEWVNNMKYKKEVRELTNFFRSVNSNDQTFMEVLYEIEDDLNIVDDAFLVFGKDYLIDKKTGEIIYAHVNEMYRGNPSYYRFVTKDNTRLGGVYGRCLLCESKWYEDSEYKRLVLSRTRPGVIKQVIYEYTDEMFDVVTKRYKCPVCGGVLHDCLFCVLNESDSTTAEFYHIKDEVVHCSKYSPSRLYGISPIVTLANHMDVRVRFFQYMQSFLEYNRYPQGALFINTGNPQQIKEMIEKAQSRYMMDRYYIPIIAVDAEKSGGNFIQYIKMTPLPEELKMLELMNLLRREEAALLGVQNVMMNDLEGVGGLNSESLQVQVTDRAALAGQTVYNDRLFPRVTDILSKYGQFDIPEELRLTVKRTDNAENDSRLANLERGLNIALAVQDMGYEAKPDFINLLGYNGRKLLPFDFRKLTKEELALAQEEGIVNRGDKTKSTTSVFHSKIPGYRTKGIDDSGNVTFDEYIVEKCIRDGKEVEIEKYYMRLDEFRCAYVEKEEYEKIVKMRVDMEKEKREKEDRERIGKIEAWYKKNADPDMRLLIFIVQSLHKGCGINDPMELAERAVKIASELKMEKDNNIDSSMEEK